MSAPVKAGEAGQFLTEGWEHVKPSDHDPDAHHIAQGKWICYKCREPIRVKPPALAGPLEVPVKVSKGRDIPPIDDIVDDIGPVHTHQITLVVNSETGDDCRWCVDKAEDDASKARFFALLERHGNRLPFRPEDEVEPYNTAVGKSDEPGFEDRLTQIGDD